ncbi:glycosyltransferase [Candidatus Saccharibacteria bacterium]|nr:glycosyltransferase [Candidatus Saccharibacteria bacterium]
MIIGQFCDTFPPNLDGVGRVTLAYCEELKKLGHAVYYVAPNHPDAENTDSLNTILSASLKIPTELHRIGVPWISPKYNKQLKAIPFDLVHAHSPFSAGREALKIAKKLNVPLVATFHSKFYDDALKITHSKVLSRATVNIIIDFFNKCDAVWAVNNGTAEVLRDYGFGGKITVIENGTDITHASPVALAKVREQIHHDKNIPLFLFVGQHNTKKNLDGVIRACQILKQKGLRFRLVTAGDGPDMDKLKHLVKKLDLLNEVQFLGFVSDPEELTALYALADLLVFPSLYDNAPMVLREAAAAGTPALLVQGSTAAESLKDGENALIATNDSPEAIATRIETGLKTLATIGQNAKKTIPIPWSKIMQKVVKEYEALIQEKQGRIQY